MPVPTTDITLRRPSCIMSASTQLTWVILLRAYYVKSVKAEKPAPKAKATRKNAAVDKSKAAPEVAAAEAIKHAHGTSRPVMSLPPPTGQPPKPAGKHARVPDTAAPRFATLVKRDSAKTT